MRIKQLSVLFIAGSVVAGTAYAEPAWPVRENKYNLERAKAQAQLAKKLEKEKAASPEAVQQMKKELFSEADKAKEAESQKVQSTLLSLVLGWKPFEKKSSDETKAGLAESSKESKKNESGTGKIERRGSSSPARSTASQNRVTTTGDEKLGTGGADAVSFKSTDSAPSRDSSAVGGGDVTSGGAEEIQFGGKK